MQSTASIILWRAESVPMVMSVPQKSAKKMMKKCSVSFIYNCRIVNIVVVVVVGLGVAVVVALLRACHPHSR